MDDTITATSPTAPIPGDTADAADAAAGPPRAPRDRRPVVNLPDGRARLVGEVAIRPDGRPDEELVLQALESSDGEALLRVGYRRRGTIMRGPMTTSAAQFGALLAALRSDALLPDAFWVASGLPGGVA